MDTIVPILLLPEHVNPNSSSLPVLKAIQRVLNESYTVTYCAHPEICGTSHIRMADPAQLADIIGTEGFTIILVHVTTAGTDQKEQFCRVVATGSAKDFGDGDVETYAQWTTNLSGTQWATKVGNQEHSRATSKQRKEGVQKFEVTAFAVSPHYQASGLGARLLNEIKWLVAGRRLQRISTVAVPMVDRLRLSGSARTFPLEGINLNRLKSVMINAETSKSDQVVHDTTNPKLVLMAIREMGKEVYFKKRGFRTVWSGTIPVGMWDCRKDCTMVYMEMNLD
jgi:GNAT superfamily N-acetyltransferase